MPKRGAAAADEILKSQQHSAYGKNDGQMTPAECTQAFSLNPEVAGATTKSEPKNGKRNGNKNEDLLCKRDNKFNSQRVGPCTRQMLVNPLRPADQVKR